MRSKALMAGFFAICSLVGLSSTFAGVYMGTEEVVAGQQVVVAGGPPVSAPFVGNPAYQEAYQEMYTNCEPYSGKGPMPARPCPAVAPAVIMPPIVAQVNAGSLKKNIARITREAGWEKLVWDPSYDYEWVGSVTITANDIQGVLSKLLEPYPLQAVFYNANHVVEILPRRNT